MNSITPLNLALLNFAVKRDTRTAELMHERAYKHGDNESQPPDLESVAYHSRQRAEIVIAATAFPVFLDQIGLEGLINELKNNWSSRFVGLLANPQFYDALRDYLNATVQFYKKLLSQDEAVDHHTVAVRLKFDSEEKYRQELQDLLQSERRFYEKWREADPEDAERIQAVETIRDELREESIRTIFR